MCVFFCSQALEQRLMSELICWFRVCWRLWFYGGSKNIHGHRVARLHCFSRFVDNTHIEAMFASFKIIQYKAAVTTGRLNGLAIVHELDEVTRA